MKYNSHKRTFENHPSHSFIGKNISFKPTLRRRNEIIAALKECQTRKQVRPASAFLGRLNFLLSTSCSSVGRAATPLVDRASNRHEEKGPSRANKHRCTHSMTHMLNFFQKLFAHLLPLVFDFRSQQRQKVVTYTVASFSEHRNRMFSQATFRARNQKSICLRCSLS